jgi:hypothetical protein
MTINIVYYCVNNAFFALDGLLFFLFVPISTFFAACGGLQYFNLMDIPSMCLQISGGATGGAWRS